MNKHAPGKLILGGCSGRMITTPGYTGTGFLADVDTLANAERLVACWNACEGIEDPSAVAYLLAALKQAYSDLQPYAPTSSGSVLARAVIMKAEARHE